MSDTTTEEEAYESWTVVELKEELAVRDLSQTGHKDELIARLEENDAAEQASDSPETPGTALEPRASDEEAPNPDPNKRIYSPYELPMNTTAAQQFIQSHPGDVDLDAVLEPPERQEMAVANIQDHVDTMAEAGMTVEDPRLEGQTDGGDGGEEEDGPHITSISPTSGTVDEETTVTVTGTGFDDTSTIEVDGDGLSTTFVSTTSLTTDYTPDAEGDVTISVRNADTNESNDVTFTVS